MKFSFKRFLNALKFPRQDVDSVRRGFRYSGGVAVYEDSAMQVSAFYRGVIYISSQIAKLPWEVKNKSNEVQENDPVNRLLNVSPNPEMAAMQFRLCMIQNAIIHGNAYAEIERDSLGRPVAIWPMPSESVELYRAPDGVLLYRVIGGSSIAVGSDVYLPLKDVFHVRNFHTKDGLNGQGIVAYATEILGISLGADRMAGNLFANGGLPSGVIEVPGKLSTEAYERVKTSWAAQHGGRKSGGVALLEEGSKFNPIIMSPTMLQFLESRKFNVLEIARFLGLPPTKLFDTDAATFSNIENSNLEVATDTLDSWARNLEGEADIKLLNKQFGGRFTELDLYAVFRGDMKTRSDYFSKMMQSAAMTPNQIRMREGMSPYSGGDRYYVATNNFSPADRIDEIVDAQIEKSEPQEPESRETEETETPDQETQARLAMAAIKYLEEK